MTHTYIRLEKLDSTYVVDWEHFLLVDSELGVHRNHPLVAPALEASKNALLDPKMWMTYNFDFWQRVGFPAGLIGKITSALGCAANTRGFPVKNLSPTCNVSSPSKPH